MNGSINNNDRFIVSSKLPREIIRFHLPCPVSRRAVRIVVPVQVSCGSILVLQSLFGAYLVHKRVKRPQRPLPITHLFRPRAVHKEVHR